MRQKIIVGLLFGLTCGILDVIPMIIQKLPLEADLSAFSLWMVYGYFLAITDINVKSFLKGMIISILVLLPNLFIIGWKEPISLIPILIITMILGSISGYFFDKYSQK